MSSLLGKYFYLSYDSAEAVKDITLKTYYLSVRLIKDAGTINPGTHSKYTTVLLGKAIDKEHRKLYVIYLDTFYGRDWIFEIDIDTRVIAVVYFNDNNALGLNKLNRIRNARVVHGKLIFTDNLNPVYQIDIERAKKSFFYGIGYDPYPTTSAWGETVFYQAGQIVSKGKHFYKCIVPGMNFDPRSETTYWEQLCFIDEAYYSMNVENFYFAPIPPDKPPVVTYKTDDSRKINSLRQTLFQFAYNYVYLDFRQSTYSPASIVALPQAEEEVATGLATELISQNNALEIVVNTGGEEVRKIRIIGRSSQDPSTWFLVEEIDKFGFEEVSQTILAEGSRLTMPSYSTMALTIKLPIIVSSGVTAPPYDTIALSVKLPTITNVYVNLSEDSLEWDYNESFAEIGIAAAKAVTISVGPGDAILFSFPAWMQVIDSLGNNLVALDNIADGETIRMYPIVNNDTYNPLTGTVVVNNIAGSSFSLTVTQNEHPFIPAVPIYCELRGRFPDPNGMTILLLDPITYTFVTRTATAYVGHLIIRLTFTPSYPGKTTGEGFTIYWRELVNGIWKGSAGSFTANNLQENIEDITLITAPNAGETLAVYLSSEEF
jgi:hypothetical protein